MSNLQDLLKPIIRGITVLEGDFANLSTVVLVLMDIKTAFKELLPRTSFKSAEKAAIIRCLDYRIKNCCKPIHKAA